MAQQFDSLVAAWRSSLQALRHGGVLVDSVVEGTSIGSGFGTAERPFAELIGYQYELTDPRNRLVFSDGYTPDVGLSIAQLFWTLSGSNSLADIAYFEPRATSFSDDGKSIRSGLGYRLFGLQDANPADSIVQRLGRDPSSRRALIVVLSRNDLTERTVDVPCFVSIQFLIRDGKLHCVLTMRSQSVLRLLPHDVFVVTVIQELLANELGVSVGKFWHTSGSFHFYIEEQSEVDLVCRESSVLPDAPVPMRPLGESIEQARHLAALVVDRLKAGDIEGVHEIMGRDDISCGFRDIVAALLWSFRWKRSEESDDRAITSIPSSLRQALFCRFKPPLGWLASRKSSF